MPWRIPDQISSQATPLGTRVARLRHSVCVPQYALEIHSKKTVADLRTFCLSRSSAVSLLFTWITFLTWAHIRGYLCNLISKSDLRYSLLSLYLYNDGRKFIFLRDLRNYFLCFSGSRRQTGKATFNSLISICLHQVLTDKATQVNFFKKMVTLYIRIFPDWFIHPSEF